MLFRSGSPRFLTEAHGHARSRSLRDMKGYVKQNRVAGGVTTCNKIPIASAGALLLRGSGAAPLPESPIPPFLYVAPLIAHLDRDDTEWVVRVLLSFSLNYYCNSPFLDHTPYP